MLSCQKINEKVFDVDDLSEDIHQKRSLILGDIFREAVLSHQEYLLKLDIGDRYQRKRIEAGFACPGCGCCKFTRKGKRQRVYKCVIGKIKVFLLQVRCITCGYRFCPYKDLIGLSFIDRISKGLIERLVEITCHLPYSQAQHFIRFVSGYYSQPDDHS